MSKGAGVQTVHLPLSKGLDQRTYKRHLEPPTLVQCDNARFKRSGALSKRPGNELYATAGTSPRRLLSYGDELVQVDGTHLRSYSAKNVTLEAKDYAFEAVPSFESIVGTVATNVDRSVAYSAAAGVLVVAWTVGSGTIYTTVLDSVTGTQLQFAKTTSTTASSGSLHVVALGSTIVKTYANGANIFARTLASDGKSWNSPSNIITDYGGEMMVCSDESSMFYVVYKSTAPSLKVKSFNAALSNVATKTGTEADAGIGSFGATVTVGERLWVSYNDTTPATDVVKACAFSNDLASETIAPFTLFSNPAGATLGRTAVARASSTTAVVAADYVTAAGGYAVVAPLVNSSGTVLSTATNRRTYWSRLLSRPFAYNGRVYAWLCSGGARWSSPPVGQQLKQYTATLVDLLATDTTATAMPARPVTWAAPRFVSNPLWAPAGVVFRTASAPEALISVEKSNNGREAMVLIKADFAHVNLAQPAELGGSLQMVPGCSYSSGGLSEFSFCYWPQEVKATTLNGGGALVAGKRYRWRIVYIHVDPRGQIDRSEPSDYTELTIGVGDNAATLTYPNLTLTTRQDLGNGFFPPVGIEVYRTTADPDDSTPYYLIFSTASTLTNDVTTESATYADIIGDNAITTNAQLYTLGGAKRRVQPPGLSSLVTYRNRLWGAHRNTLWYSGAFVEGEAPWWSDDFNQPLDTNEDITALWVMDDTLYASTASRIYYLQADGPADNGAQNDIGIPFRIATDWGCIEPRSVVVTPLGTLYQSAVGIQLLTRSRQIDPQVFGLRVQDTLADFPTITSALVHPDGGYVLFFCTNGSTSVRIGFDYTAGEWFTDTASIFGVFASATVRNGSIYWLNASSIYVESADFLDAGAFVTRTVELADFHPTGILGFMKLNQVQVQGERLTAHGLTFALAKDYATTYFDTRAYTDSEITLLNLEQVGIAPLDQRSQAMRLKITDTAPTVGALGTGEGCDLVAVTFEYDPLGNAFQLPSGARK